MIRRTYYWLMSVACLVFAMNANAREIIGLVKKTQEANKLNASCAAATAQTDLDINNVRAKILGGGDMWWDLVLSARYEIPKGSKNHSLFAGSLWIGGYDAAGGQLKVAAMTYRQNGNDYFPGPLGTGAEIDASECSQWDKHFKMTRAEVDNWVGAGVLSDAIKHWPAHGDVTAGQEYNLAPYVDGDGDGEYNPSETQDPDKRDYPAYILNNNQACVKDCNKPVELLYGDQTLWWVINDKGNIHTESSAQPIGIEIQCQAFGFQTNDDINNMTFYNYKVINRSPNELKQTYFGQWVDTDLGYYLDDYVGCDVRRGLGYCYNGNSVDGTGAPGSYGANPPCIGVDFFQGPIADVGDLVDNNRNGVIDEPCEEIIMSKFVYYNNDFSVQGNPKANTDYYNYLSGFWKDGTPFTYGGNAKGGPSGTETDFMFPGDTDPDGGPYWDEVTAGNSPADRRFLQSAGPFTLKAGAVNRVTVGAVWARATSGGNLASIALMKSADDKAQSLFDNCFKVVDGPDAPDITIQEFSNQLVLYLSNKPTSNNYQEKYEEVDPLIPNNNVLVDNKYHFEGYKIYQLKDATVTAADLHNPDKTRLIYQGDVKNGVKNLINFYANSPLCPSMGGSTGSCPVQEVTGADNGVIHSIVVNEDKFATGDDKKLVNHKQYYFLAVAYAYNEYKKYDPNDPTSLDGQKAPYKEGRRNVGIKTGIPHIPTPEHGGTSFTSGYGSGVKITRIEGQGNGGNILDLTSETVNEILASSESRSLNPVYEAGRGPVNIKIIDPLNVPEAEFEIKLGTLKKNFVSGVFANSGNSIVPSIASYIDFTEGWELTNKTLNVTVKSDKSIAFANEQLFPDWGISVTINQPLTWPDLVALDPNTTYKFPDNNGYLTSSISYADDSKRWLSYVPDVDEQSPRNWIRSGRTAYDQTNSLYNYDDYDVHSTSGKILGQCWDEGQVFESSNLNGWAPYRLVGGHIGNSISTPALSEYYSSSYGSRLIFTSSVDIVITPDKSKWTRCPVLEMSDNANFSEGNAKKFMLRRHASVDKDGKATVGSDNNDHATGMGWFPGYAINVETGERLNIAFGEDSGYPMENGKDMIWNPTGNPGSFFFNGNTGTFDYDAVFGGKHMIFVFGHNGDRQFPIGNSGVKIYGDIPRYDRGEALFQLLNNFEASGYTNTMLTRLLFKDVMWVNIPLLAQNHKLLETEAKVRLRVSKPYQYGYSANWGSVVLPNGSSWSASPADRTIDITSSPQNDNRPMYTFNTFDVKTKKNDKESAKAALDLINIVPNPYYAYSAYETDQLDNRVKITNLPAKCKVRIYTLNGTLIRTYNKDEPSDTPSKRDEPLTSIDWDLKNQANIPISSGMYIIHVDVPGVGEKVIKWFGVVRPIDLDNF